MLNVDVCYVNANDSPLFVLFALTLAKREREEGGGDNLQNEGKFVNKFKYIFLFSHKIILGRHRWKLGLNFEVDKLIIILTTGESWKSLPHSNICQPVIHAGEQKRKLEENGEGREEEWSQL